MLGPPESSVTRVFGLHHEHVQKDSVVAGQRRKFSEVLRQKLLDVG